VFRNSAATTLFATLILILKTKLKSRRMGSQWTRKSAPKSNTGSSAIN
jgi:hypothetical protein